MPENILAWHRRLVDIGGEPTDTEDDRLAKSILVGTALLVCALSPLWWATLFLLERPWSALIPGGYMVMTLAWLAAVRRGAPFRPFLRSQMTMLVLPALLQWSLGGFASSGGMIMWGFAAAMAAQIFSHSPWRWMGAYAGLLVVSLAIDPWLATTVEPLTAGWSRAFFYMNLGGVALATILLIRYFISQRDRARSDLETERKRSEDLLLNVLPEPIAERLKRGESPIADISDSVTVLFADIVDFTPLASGMSASDVVVLLGGVFSHFDELSARFGLEKIKTVGDAYMVVGGIPEPLEDHVAAAVEFGFAALDVARSAGLEMRVGIDTGPVVAGVLGMTKFAYDLWGDTVNTAARMESHGVPGHIQVTGRVRAALQGRYEFETRGEIDVKGKGSIETFFVKRARIGEPDHGQAMLGTRPTTPASAPPGTPP